MAIGDTNPRGFSAITETVDINVYNALATFSGCQGIGDY